MWRVAFRRLGPGDRIARRNADALDTEELAVIRARLARFDRAAAWTTDTLRLIGASPTSSRPRCPRSSARAPGVLDVRKLKDLSLTESVDVGRRLSPRGEAVLGELP